MFSELNYSVLEQKKLEKIFIDCVEEVQNSVKNRREVANSNLNKTISSKFKIKDIFKEGKNIVPYDYFLPSDKMKLITSFFLSNEVISLVHDTLFAKTNYAKNDIYKLNSYESNNNSILSYKNSLNNNNNNQRNFTYTKRNKINVINNFKEANNKLKKMSPFDFSLNVNSKLKNKLEKFYNS